MYQFLIWSLPETKAAELQAYVLETYGHTGPWWQCEPIEIHCVCDVRETEREANEFTGDFATEAKQVIIHKQIFEYGYWKTIEESHT